MEKPAHTHTHTRKQAVDCWIEYPTCDFAWSEPSIHAAREKMFGYTTDNYNLLVLAFHFVHPLTKIWVEIGPFCQSTFKQVDLPLYFLCLLVKNWKLLAKYRFYKGYSKRKMLKFKDFKEFKDRFFKSKNSKNSLPVANLLIPFFLNQ